MSNNKNSSIQPAATIIVARDSADGIETLMLLRNPKSDFVGGVYVFPGGMVDDIDRHPEMVSVCQGLSDNEASECLGMPQDGLAYWVAAIRECFEEAGILIAVDKRGEFISLDKTDTAARFLGYRNALFEGRTDLMEICRTEGLRLAVGRIAYFSHWITPEVSPRRYDTRFFVGISPARQEGFHDKTETIAHTWIRPEDALTQHKQGEFKIILPTIKHLEALSGIDNTEDLMAMARARRDIPTIMPKIVVDEKGVRPVIPGDPDYPG